jgi:hypothetical protein
MAALSWVRKVRRQGAPTKPGGYPAIENGALTWTDNAQDPNRLLFTTRGGTPIQHTNF